MNIKNVVKRIGVVFIVSPLFIIGFIFNVISWFTVLFWGPIYYIITGKDPLNEDILEFPLDYCCKLTDLYLEKFGPDDR